MRCHPVTSPTLLAMGTGQGLLSPSSAAAGTDSSPSPALCSPEATVEGHSCDAKGRVTASLDPAAPPQEEKENPWRESFQSLKGCTEEPGGDSTSYGTDQSKDSPREARWDRHRNGGTGRQRHS